jgi:hypothetical protein
MRENEDEHSPELARPFCFCVVVWGEQFRNYFLQYCLPSLLAPGNIPALAGKRPAEYIVATTAEDWQAMQRTAIFRTLERYAKPILLELPPQTAHQPNWEYSVVGLKLYCEAVFQRKAYRIFTVPDYLYADGTVARLNELATSGAQAVLINPQPRIVEEPFFAALKEMGILPNADCRDTGAPLVYQPRQLVSAALRSLHSMTIVNEWDTPYFCGYAASPWWRVDGVDDGILICGLGWNPLLIDYGAVPEHDTSLIDARGLDGDYDMRTIGHLKTIYAVTDTDEIYTASWSSAEYMAQPERRQIFGELGKGTAFRASYYGPHFNWLHRNTLFFPVRLHAGPLGDQWDKAEERALGTLLTWLDPPADLEAIGRDLPIARQKYEAIESKIDAYDLPAWRRSDTTQRRIRNFLLLLTAALLHPITCSFPNSPRLRWLISSCQVGSRHALRSLGGNETSRAWWSARARKAKLIPAGWFNQIRRTTRDDGSSKRS